jgi:hypothetical protein
MRAYTLIAIAASVGLALGTPRRMHAGILVFDRGTDGLTAFNEAAGRPPISISFDNIPLDTNLNGVTMAGVTLRPSATGAPLFVVRGDLTVTPSGFINAPFRSTNKLFPTSGQRVLSPGGRILGPAPNRTQENDDLRLDFSPPVSAFGFDLLLQAADGDSLIRIRVFNQSNALLFDGIVPIPNLGGIGAPGRAEFWGAVTTEADLIGRIVINEFDEDNVNPDSNIGFDTFRFFPAAGRSELQEEEPEEEDE